MRFGVELGDDVDDDALGSDAIEGADADAAADAIVVDSDVVVDALEAANASFQPFMSWIFFLF